jgi:hypothetical protein
LEIQMKYALIIAKLEMQCAVFVFGEEHITAVCSVRIWKYVFREHIGLYMVLGPFSYCHECYIPNLEPYQMHSSCALW